MILNGLQKFEQTAAIRQDHTSGCMPLLQLSVFPPDKVNQTNPMLKIC
jgi:hypothetical protein